MWWKEGKRKYIRYLYLLFLYLERYLYLIIKKYKRKEKNIEENYYFLFECR